MVPRHSSNLTGAVVSMGNVRRCVRRSPAPPLPLCDSSLHVFVEFLLNLHCKRDMMAVASLFSFASLTDGRIARDLPKQHPGKKERYVRKNV